MGRLVVVRAEAGPSFVDALLDAWEHGDAVLPLDPRLPPPAASTLTESLGADQPVDEGDAVVVPTSGTTGDPKGVVLTHDALRASATVTSARLKADPERDIWLSCLPLAHIGGLSVVVRSLLTGTSLTFDPDAPATLVSLVPTHLLRMEVSRFRAVLLGGAAPPDDPPPNCIVTYGLTETGSGVVYDGRPLDGVEVRSVDGELLVRGPMLFRCYRDGVDPKDGDGWFPTGDAGTVDDDGTVRVVGRMGDLIVTGGEKVWPDAVERVVRTMPGVADIAVAGRPDPEWGQRVVAWIVPSDQPPTLDDVRLAVKEELPAYCAPKEIVLVEALPRTALGKVKRADLDHP